MNDYWCIHVHTVSIGIVSTEGSLKVLGRAVYCPRAVLNESKPKGVGNLGPFIWTRLFGFEI
ncbi:hypothetical protein PAXRUDRAFT_825088 [Paxillus rubicundulus Ve08.2h10]|uniref:Uncharacterized protein n=1 Tax=Paxillus rubicundulus Ve08.2h10 TaxID=930991 RepID=A0A0D0DTL3_9AGAM|nr:hypothetical protein PAXRUDRAFT_825088 [Paxillus rubicundulus Ve08.2h10]